MVVSSRARLRRTRSPRTSSPRPRPRPSPARSRRLVFRGGRGVRISCANPLVSAVSSSSASGGSVYLGLLPSIITHGWLADQPDDAARRNCPAAHPSLRFFHDQRSSFGTDRGGPRSPPLDCPPRC